MQQAHKNTSVLSISSKKLSNCKDVLSFLHGFGLACSVTSTQNLVRYGNELRTEPGCRILLNSHLPNAIDKKLWSQMRKEFGLQCAHLDVQGKFTGCINDYFKTSDCTAFKE